MPRAGGAMDDGANIANRVPITAAMMLATMMPLSGWLALKVGRRPMFLISIAGFTVASMLCGVAQTLPEMVACRFIQGCAGAGMMPLSQTVMLDLFPLRQLPIVMSVWSSVIVLGPILGPTA